MVGDIVSALSPVEVRRTKFAIGYDPHRTKSWLRSYRLAASSPPSRLTFALPRNATRAMGCAVSAGNCECRRDPITGNIPD